MGCGKVADYLLENGDGWVVFGGDAEVDGEFGGRVVLAKGRSEAFVQLGLEALDGADDGDMGDLVEWESGRDGLARWV